MRSCGRTWVIGVVASVIAGVVGGAPAAAAAAGAAARVQDDAAAQRRVALYDVRDLLPSARRAAGSPQWGRLRAIARERERGDAGAGGSVDAQDAVAASPAELDEACTTLLSALLRGIATRFDPGSDVGVEPAGSLRVTAAPGVHVRVADLLLALRTHRAPAIEVEAVFFELDEGQRRELERFVAAEGSEVKRGTPVLLLDPGSVRRFLDRSAVNVTSMPRIVSESLSPFAIQGGGHVSYVADMEQVVIEGLGTIADPVVRQLFEGLVIEGTGVCGEFADDGTAPCALQLHLRSSLLKRPIATAKTDLGTIQLPELRHAEMRTTIAGTSGRAVLIGGVPKPSFDDDDHDDAVRVYLLVTLRAVAPK